MGIFECYLRAVHDLSVFRTQYAALSTKYRALNERCGEIHEDYIASELRNDDLRKELAALRTKHDRLRQSVGAVIDELDDMYGATAPD